MRRLSLNDYQISRIYEWRLAMKQGMGEVCCEHCNDIEKKLRDFLDKPTVKLLQRLVNKHPYFIDGKVVRRDKYKIL